MCVCEECLMGLRRRGYYTTWVNVAIAMQVDGRRKLHFDVYTRKLVSKGRVHRHTRSRTWRNNQLRSVLRHLAEALGRTVPRRHSERSK